MSVVKANRNESRFIVFRNIYKLRQTINNELLFDFGYRRDKADAKLLRKIGVPNGAYEDLDEKQKAHYDRLRQKYDAYDNWFLNEMKTEILGNLRDITREIFMANSVYPTCREELIERRIHQDRAIGYCAQLEQNLFAVIMELPVDHNRYTRIAKDIEYEIHLIKQWRKSDARFKRMIDNGESSLPPVTEKDAFPEIDEATKLLSENPAAKTDEYVEKILEGAINLEELDTQTRQQSNKGMPERVFVRRTGSF